MTAAYYQTIKTTNGEGAKGRYFSVFLVLISLMGGVFLGISPLLSATAILVCAVAFFLDVFSKGTMNRAAVFGLLFLFMTFLSGIFFGGFNSLRNASIVYWIANEGRVFLYYWPALFVMQALPLRGTEFMLHRIFRIATCMVFGIMIAYAATGWSTFSTYHAAGAFCSIFVFYNLFCYEKSKSRWDLFFLGLSLAAIFATNSRTSLLAVLVTMVILHFNATKIKQALKITVFVAPLALTMPFLFPNQFGRLADAFNTETFTSLGENFMLAYRSDSPIEVAKAFDLSSGIQISGNANLVIRGYLWGRSLGEGTRSPIVGSGFGRLNDLGRSYEGVPYLIYAATSATVDSPSNLTAHNGYMQVFAELGLLGSLLLFGLYRTLWVGLSGMTVWSQTGRASIVCLLLMSITQHAFGAPIYGLSLLLTAAMAYRISLGEKQQSENAPQIG